MPRPLLALALALLPLAASAQPSEADFDRFDRDKSGTLSREELPEGARAGFDRIDADKNGSLSRPEFAEAVRRLRRGAEESIRVERDLPYAGTDNPRQRLDLYLPKQPKSSKLPVIVFIHGGAWMGGSKDGHLGQLAPFVRTGDYAAASVGYRLTDEAQWPAQIHDCKAAIRWIKANAAKYGLDPDRIAVWGTSAGGHLVAMLGTSGDVPELEGDLGPRKDADGKDLTSKVACVANYFGPTDLPAMIGPPSQIDHAAPNAPEARLIGGALPDNADKAKAASPITYVSAGDPPVLTVHGTDDPLVPYAQAVRFDKALRAAGVTSYLVAVQGAGHGDFRGDAVPERLRAFLAKHLLGQEATVSTEPIDQRAKADDKPAP